MALRYYSTRMKTDGTRLRRRIAKAPVDPGVYRWLDKDGTVLYVGKAKNLRSRLRSYVGKPEKHLGPWKLSLREQLCDFDCTVTNSELEALVLETNLIKELQPKYNVLMKDGKNYVYVKVSLQEAYPRVEVVRRMEDGGARFFGPFLSAFETRRSLDMLQELFQFRACKPSLDALNRQEGDAEAVYGTGKLKPCLDFQIGQCCGLCAGALSREEYHSRIERVVDFFKGNFDPVLERAQALMKQAAKERKFEKAKELRDAIQSVEFLREKQLVSDTSGDDVDVFGVALLSGKAHVVVFHKREGRVIGEEHFSLVGRAEELPEVLEQVLPQYYASAQDVPTGILVPGEFPERGVLEAFLTERRGRKVTVRIPERGAKSKLLELAEKNAEQKAKQAEAAWEADQRNTKDAVAQLQETLDLPRAPQRIEGYDISHTGGTETVGSMVVCIEGKPRNDQYRSFTIRSMQRGAIDDYRALAEVLSRRLRHAAGGLFYEEAQWKEHGVSVGKPRKAEQGRISEIAACVPGCVLPEPQHRSDLIARSGEEIVGLIVLSGREGGNRELACLWVSESYAHQSLPVFLIRKAVASCKKGKVYAVVDAPLEEQYAAIGFRHVLKTPAACTASVMRAQKCGMHHPIVMLYEASQQKPDSSLAAMPDLLVIDGGKGQLHAVCAVVESFQLSIPVIALAKREEEVFVSGKSDPVFFAPDSPAKFLLMRLRDEAHRFANRHRSARAARHATESQLDRIPGIGPDTRQALLRRFGSVDVIRQTPDAMLRELLSEEQLLALRRVL